MPQQSYLDRARPSAEGRAKIECELGLPAAGGKAQLTLFLSGGGANILGMCGWYYENTGGQG